MADSATKLSIKIGVDGIPELGKLRNALGSVEASTVKLGKEFVKGRLELKKLEQSIKPTINSTRSLRDAYREMANQVEFGSRKFKVATQEAERLDKQLAKMERRGGRFGGARGIAQTVGTVAGAGVFGGFEGAAGALIGAGFGPAGAIVGGAIGAQVGQARQALGAAAEYASEISKLRIALRGVTQDAGEYGAALGIIDRATKDFAIPQSVLTRQFTKLQAAVEGAGGNVADTETAFRGIVAAVRATGGSLQDVDSALTATAQVFSKGKVSAEELRQQIGERLSGAFSLFAESIGLTPQELDKALERGQVSLQDFQKFAELLFKRYGETAQEIADGPEGAGDRLKVALEELNEAVGVLLKPIGAAFQTVFTDIVNAITAATLELQKFLNLGQGRQENLIKERNQILKDLRQRGRFFDDEEKRVMRARLLQISAQLSTSGALDQSILGGKKSGLPGIDTDTTTKEPSGRRGRQDISMALMNAQIAAIRETVEGKKLELEFEARLLEIRESGEEPRKRFVQLTQALVDLEEGRVRIAEKQRREEEKRVKQYDNMIKGFTLGNAKQFDMNAQVKQKTPFDAFIEGAKEFEKSLGGVMQATKELAQVGFKGLGDAITELVVNGTLNFREFAASLLRDMARIIMQQIVVKSLMQAIGFAGGGVDPSSYALANAPQYSAAGVNIGSSAFGLPGFAKGGITRGPSIAGEAGPEAVVPLPDGRSIPVMMSGTGTGNLVVNVDAKGTSVQGDSTRSNALGEAIGSAVRQELIRQRRPGGLLS